MDNSGNVMITMNKEFLRPVEVNHLCGDSTKAEKELGWKPEVNFEGMVAMMVQSDLERLRKTL